jgi:hypothetical protein
MLHNSTFSHVKNNSDQTAMVFANGTTVLVADNIWKNQRLYLIDLVTATQMDITLPAKQQVDLRHFVYGGDVIYALYSDQNFQTVVYRVSQDGTITELIPIDHVSLVEGKEPPGAEQFEAMLENGELNGLHMMEKQLCVWDAANEHYNKQGVGRVRYLANERYFVTSNVPTIHTRVRQDNTITVTDTCMMRTTPAYGRYRLEIARTSAKENSLESELDARIRTATLYRDEQAVHTYSFNDAHNFYYRAIWVGSRLYFVGTNVAYVDLDSLP